jgi:O-phosphoseryl-tRNA synthetase
MPFDSDQIRRDLKHDYEKTWKETKNLLKIEGNFYTIQDKSKSHIVNDFICEARKIMLSLGFEEIILPMFIDEEEIYKQYGPEAALILDRVFYLAGIPRPDIGISNEKIQKMQEVVRGFNRIEELKAIFRRYKKAEIEADDLIEALITELEIEESKASELIDKIFPELKHLSPIPSKMTLRSHTTALWFLVLGELVKKKKLPLQYFTIGPKFRREQKVDATHLYTSNTLSLVVMANEISLEDCINIALQICRELGFKKCKTEIKGATSKYYAPQTEFEIFVQHPSTKEWIELGDGGFYSPVSLAQYHIQYPVFNAGFGIERMCMIKSKITDIRKLVYPYFYEDMIFTDEEISKSLIYRHEPLTKEGIEIKGKIIEVALSHKQDKSPIELEVWSGFLKNKKIRITIWENDKDVFLLGPAALNKIWVQNGNILGLPPEKVILNAVDSGLTYLEGIASEMAYNVELMVDQSNDSIEHRVKLCNRASEINLYVDDIILEYIHSHQKKIDIRGPVFIGLSCKRIQEKP